MEEKEIHQGHRERLTNLVAEVGLENVSDVQALEWILTLVFPRGDTNPLAHRLLDKYGDFANIVESSVSDLNQVHGLNTRSSTTLHMLEDVVHYFSSCKLRKKTSLKDSEAFLDILEEILRFRPTENLYIFAIDHSFRLIQKRRYDLKQVSRVGIDPFQLYDFISSTKPSYLLIVHNHPNGTANPSKDDHEAVKYIESLISNLQCKLLDSLIVGQDGIYSEMKNEFVRYFNNFEKVVNFVKK